MKAMVSLSGVAKVAIILAIFSAISTACSLYRDKRHLPGGLPIPINKAGECIKSKLSNRDICYPSFESLDESCLRQAAPSSQVPLIPNARVKSMTFLPPRQYARMVMQSFQRHGLLMPTDTRLPYKPFVYVHFECQSSYQLVDEAQFLFCTCGRWTGTRPECVKKLY